jgi:bleomycin hydrolase
MKRTITALALIWSLGAIAQDKPKTELIYKFTPVKENTVGLTEDQCATGTCWSFATISFLEAEIIRKGNKPVDLSEMFNVRVNYVKKADSYVRYQGKQQFGPGGLSHDVLAVVQEYGLVPEAAFPGAMDANNEYNHGGLDAMMESTVKTVLDKKLNESNNEWKQTIESMLDAGVGKMPTMFEFDGKKYSPASFRDAMKINAADYVSITSFSHHPFYSSFVLEVPDNWMKGSFYNVPLEDLQKIADNAIDNGYTIAWDADVSEKGFSFSNGMALLPDASVKKEEMWSTAIKEAAVTQQSRQTAFDTFSTTDDHLMHITGKAKDQFGNVYFTTKNSWGKENPFGGYQYVSKNYFQMKTVGIMIHKDAIPKEIKVKLGII